MENSSVSEYELISCEGCTRADEAVQRLQAAAEAYRATPQSNPAETHRAFLGMISVILEFWGPLK